MNQWFNRSTIISGTDIREISSVDPQRGQEDALNYILVKICNVKVGMSFITQFLHFAYRQLTFSEHD